MVPGGFSWFLMVPGCFFHGIGWVVMVFHGSRFVFHGSRSVFHGYIQVGGFSLFLVGFSLF